MNKIILILIVFILIVFSCTKEIKVPVDLGNKVELVTSAISNITSDSAKCGGTILKDGQETITKRGICWSIYNNPTHGDDGPAARRKGP